MFTLTLSALAATAAAREPWTGNVLTYRNSVSLMTLQEGEELTYNPYYAMTLSVRPTYWVNDIFYVHGRFSVTRELTNSDITTDRGETWVSDLIFRLAAHEFYTIDVVGISFSASLDIITPTSPISRARTLQIGLAPGIRISRDFDVLSGIGIGYGFRVTGRIHDKTTAERESPIIGGCSGTTGGCDEYLNTGLRNPYLRLSHSFDLSVGFLDWLGLEISAALMTDYLHDEVTSTNVSHTPQADQDQRFYVASDVAIVLKPMPSLGIRIGAETLNPQLAPDSTFYAPFFNRYTEFYLDLTLDVAGLVSQINGREDAEAEAP